MSKLLEYQDLIRLMPVNEHSEKITLEKYTSPPFINYFKESLPTQISKLEIKQAGKEGKIEELILKSIMWGYPKGFTDGRNIHIKAFENSYFSLIDFLTDLQSKRRIDFSEIGSKKFSGIGFSTMSKFLYFLDIEINECKPLILDTVIANVLSRSSFAEKEFEKLNYDTLKRHYVSYLKYMQKQSKLLNVEPENIEMFLFIFGKIL